MDPTLAMTAAVYKGYLQHKATHSCYSQLNNTTHYQAQAAQYSAGTQHTHVPRSQPTGTWAFAFGPSADEAQ